MKCESHFAYEAPDFELSRDSFFNVGIRRSSGLILHCINRKQSDALVVVVRHYLRKQVDQLAVRSRLKCENSIPSCNALVKQPCCFSQMIFKKAR